MLLHTVQPNETVYTIAQLYNIPVERLLRDNNLPPNYTLNIGQSLIITYPSQTYIVQENDTPQSVADAFGITTLQLLRNNPFLSDRDFLYVGEELVISYEHKQQIEVNGFAFSHINQTILRKALPFLTYLTIINYRVTPEGTIINVNDSEVIKTAKEYGVAPIMMISSVTERGIGSYGTTHTILTNPDVQYKMIDNILSVLEAKGFYGINLGFQFILLEDLPLYVDFIEDITTRLNSFGYTVFVTLIPSTFGYIPGVQTNIPYYSTIGRVTNNVILMSYQWSRAYIPTVAQTTVQLLQDYLDYVVTQIPPEKIFIGITRIAYDWELPYVEGETIGSSLSNDDALQLANQTGAVIHYDESTQTPYFYYNTSGVEHFVWFKDARSINAITELVIEYGLRGVSVWNIMYFSPQPWLVMNSQYEIVSVLNQPREPS